MGHENWIELSLGVLNNGQILVSGSLDKTIKLWDWMTGQCLKTIDTGLNIYSLASIESKMFI
jgi:WD40 repeat protein